MLISNRQEKIIHLLMQSSGYIHASALADYLQVSVKTVYRELAAINDLLGQDFIEKKPGHGIKIQIDKYSEQLKKNFSSFFSAGISAVQRRKYIYLFLLFTSPYSTSILKLAELTVSSPNSVAGDLGEIEKQLSQSAQRLVIIRSKAGTSIRGGEKELRHQISWLLKDEALSDNLHSTLFPAFFPIVKEMIKDFPLVNHSPIIELVEQAEEKFQFVLENPYYANFCLYLFVLVKRYQLGKPYEKLEPELVAEEYIKISRFLVEGLEKSFRLRMCEFEVLEVAQILFAYRKSAPEMNGCVEEDSLAAHYTKELIAEVAGRQGMRLNDEALFSMILTHVRLMYDRLKYGVVVLNPLLDKIKLEFEQLFLTVKKASSELNQRYRLAELTEDEIAYLTLYFQGAFEVVGQKKRAIIICSTGLGTSQFLKNKIEKAFPELIIQKVLSSRALSEAECFKETDFVISTVWLKACPCPCVLISSMFNEKDRENIRKKMEELSGND